MHRSLFTLFALAFSLSLFAQKQGGQTSSQANASIDRYEKVNFQLQGQDWEAELKSRLMEEKPILNASGTSLMLERAIESPGGWHYAFQQSFQGIAIYDAGIKATLTKQGRVINLINNLVEFPGNAPAFLRSTEEAEVHCFEQYSQGHPDFRIEGKEKRYFLQNGQAKAVHVLIYTADTYTYELILDDADFSEIAKRDIASYCKPLTQVDTVGSAMVFYPDPLTSSGNAYGGTFSDNNDNDHADLNSQRQQVVLKDITWNGATFELKGPYVSLEDREAPTGAPATSTTGDFNFTRSEQGFEDVMVYYHIDTFQRYVQSLGFTNLQNSPVVADPHGLNFQDNSHFIPSPTDPRLGFGEGGVDDAEDADVIIHEYGHALSYAASPGTNSGLERQGLDEGIGDYLAATYSRGISYTFWKNTFTWDGHNEFWSGRSASDPTLYPPGGSDIYLYGAIWASTLMEVWPQIGKEASDRVFLQSLFGNANNITLRDAAQIIMDADTLLYGGAHHDQYQEAFCNRGIFTGTLPGQACWVAATPPSNQEFSFEIFPNPSNGNLQIECKQFRQNMQYEVLDMMGRKIQEGKLHASSSALDLANQPAGSYFIKVYDSFGRMASKKLILQP